MLFSPNGQPLTDPKAEAKKLEDLVLLRTNQLQQQVNSLYSFIIGILATAQEINGKSEIFIPHRNLQKIGPFLGKIDLHVDSDPEGLTLYCDLPFEAEAPAENVAQFPFKPN